MIEDERRPDRRVERTITVFLAGAECPFTCSFCDLWRWTIDGPTPPGALPKQLGDALASTREPLPDRLKLYNASNFFDPRAVPDVDVPAIAALASRFAGVTVESHARMLGPRTLAFAERVRARLEVAIGLETVHPVALERLNKRLDLAAFDAAARFMADHEMDLRVFVLLGAPHVPAAESVEWTTRTVRHAVDRGARVVAIIPVRGGNGALEELQSLGHFTPPTLRQLESALDASIEAEHSAVSADLWDAQRLLACDVCRDARVDRLRRMNLTGRLESPVHCADCRDA